MRILAIRATEEFIIHFFTEGSTHGFQVRTGLPADCKLLATRVVDGIVEFLFIEQEHMEDDVNPWVLPVEIIQWHGDEDLDGH